MTAVRTWLRLDLRRRWRSLAVLALLVAVATGTILASVAGARRGGSALARLQAVLLESRPGVEGRVVADNTPVFYVPPLTALGLVLIVPVALLLVNLLAAWPGHRAARLRIGHVLRAE